MTRVSDEATTNAFQFELNCGEFSFLAFALHGGERSSEIIVVGFFQKLRKEFKK